MDGTAKWFLTADAKLKIDLPGKNLDYIKSWNIVKFEGRISLFKDSTEGASEEAGKFFISVLNAESSPFGGKLHKGSGTCPNKQWKTVFQAIDTENNALNGIEVNVTNQESDMTFAGETEFYAYLYDGTYVATGTINGIDIRKEFEVDGKKQTVKLQEGRILVYGNISDVKTKEGISGASVVVLSPNGSTVGQTSANEYGNYQLLLPAGMIYTFKFSANSYTSKEEMCLIDGEMDFPVDVALEKVKCTVTFNANGGTATTGSMTVSTGKKLSSLPTAFRDGYDFTGWNTTADGSGDAFTTSTTINKDIIVYAVWNIISQNVYNGHYYQIIDDSLSWTEAKSYCESIGGYLACITSEGEQNFIESLIEHGGARYYWIGAADATEEGVWSWISGEPFVYSNWGDTQPDDQYYSEGEDYVAIARNNESWAASGHWNDFSVRGSGVSNSGFVCEWNNTFGPR